MSPGKASKYENGGGVNFLGAICNIEHLDIEPDVPLHSNDVDALIQHKLNLDEDPYEVEIDMNACLKELTLHMSQNFHKRIFKSLTQLQTKLRFNAWLDSKS